MTSKVFLFDNTHWLYCNDVSFKDGVYHGRVINGEWTMWASTVDNTVKSSEHCDKTKMVWACDPNTESREYNQVIQNARERYAAGEPANFDIGSDKDFELYQKLKAKYENDEYDLYLELREKYEDDEIPF